MVRPGVIQDTGLLESRGAGRDSAGEAGSTVGLHGLGDVVAQRDLDHHACENGAGGHGHGTEDDTVRAPPCARLALSTSGAFGHLFLAPFCGQCRHHPRFTGGETEAQRCQVTCPRSPRGRDGG